MYGFLGPNGAGAEVQDICDRVGVINEGRLWTIVVYLLAFGMIILIVTDRRDVA